MMFLPKSVKSRTWLRWQKCMLLAFLIALPASSLAAQNKPPQQLATVPGQSPSSPQRSSKEEVADAARDATLWLLSAPVLPVVCFVAALIIAAVWTWLAVKHRIKILTGTVTVGGEGAPQIRVQVRAVSGYSTALNTRGGLFTVYDIPEEDLELELTLSDPGVPAPTSAPSLKYALGRNGARTLPWNVQLPLRPAAMNAANAGGTNRTVSWQDPVPIPAATRSSVRYLYTLEVGVRGAPGYTGLTFSQAGTGAYVATVQKDSIVKFITKIEGLSAQLTSYLTVS